MNGIGLPCFIRSTSGVTVSTGRLLLLPGPTPAANIVLGLSDQTAGCTGLSMEIAYQGAGSLPAARRQAFWSVPAIHRHTERLAVVIGLLSVANEHDARRGGDRILCERRDT